MKLENLSINLKNKIFDHKKIYSLRNSNNSSVENTFILVCLPNDFSSDQIGQLLSERDNAKNETSFIWGVNFDACKTSREYDSLETADIFSYNVLYNKMNSPSDIPENFFIFSLFLINSSKAKYGEISLIPLSKRLLINFLLDESLLKKENKIFVSRINSSGGSIFSHTLKPSLLASFILASSAISFICSSVNLLFDNISSAKENLIFLSKSFKAFSNDDFKEPTNSSGTSNLIIISSMLNSEKTDLNNFLLEVLK